MDDLLRNKKVIIFCIIILLVAGIIFLIGSGEKKVELVYENDNNLSYLKKYGVNEYIPVYVEEADVVIKYLNDFKNSMIYDTEYSYNLLNKQYRDKKFGSVESYQKYIDKILGTSIISLEIEAYKKIVIDGINFYDIYDISGNHYIFKELSIMNYEVFLDNYTVEIK